MTIMNDIWADLGRRFPGDPRLAARDFALLAEPDADGFTYVHALSAPVPRPRGWLLKFKEFQSRFDSGVYARDLAREQAKADAKLAALLAEPAARAPFEAALTMATRTNSGTPVHLLMRTLRVDAIGLLAADDGMQAALARAIPLSAMPGRAYNALTALTDPNPMGTDYKMRQGMTARALTIVDTLDSRPATRAAMVEALKQQTDGRPAVLGGGTLFLVNAERDDGRPILRDRLRGVLAPAAKPGPR